MRKLIAALAALALLAMFGVLLSRPQAVYTKVEPRLPKPKPVMTLEQQLAGLQKLRHDVRKGRQQGTTGEAFNDLLKRHEELSVDPSLLDSTPAYADHRRVIRTVQRDLARVMPMIRARVRETEKQSLDGSKRSTGAECAPERLGPLMVRPQSSLPAGWFRWPGSGTEGNSGGTAKAGTPPNHEAPGHPSRLPVARDGRNRSVAPATAPARLLSLRRRAGGRSL